MLNHSTVPLAHMQTVLSEGSDRTIIANTAICCLQCYTYRLLLEYAALFRTTDALA